MTEFVQQRAQTDNYIVSDVKNVVSKLRLDTLTYITDVVYIMVY